MKLDKRDLFIKQKLQEDKTMSSKANEIFEKFEGGIKLKNNNETKERKVIKISLNQAILAFTSLMIVFVLGGNLYAHLNGKPNLYSAIKGLFVKEDKYVASEIVVDQMVESSGIRLTLKTVAMDENVLITKYVAEGEKLASEFYTYTEFEEDMVDLAKKYYASKKVNIGEDKYKNVKSSDVTAAYNNVKSKLVSVGISTSDANDIAETGNRAYIQYIGAQLGVEGTTSENAKELISETIAMFESKVSSKYEIIKSLDTLENFDIDIVSQKIEKNGNQYIIYNVYNVDTISDLSSKFNLKVSIEQIGSAKGTWNFNTELEKARLDTRVETIDFYNTETNVYGNEEDGYIKVGIKRLVISDFSSVLMLQKDSEYYNDNSTESLLKNTYTYVVTDESGNILGTGGTKKEELVYADRIILENVNMNTKILKVNVYSNINNELLKTITVDIEKARTEKHIELNQSLYNESHGIALNYPGDWKQVEKQSVNQGVELYSTEDIDGNATWIFIERMQLNDIENGKIILGDPDEFKDVIKTSIEVSGYTGNDYVYTYAENIKERQIRVVKDDVMYYIRYRGNLTQFERYYETFEEILKTVSFVEVEPEKSYVAYYSDSNTDSLETVKVYEDNTATIQISQHAKDIFGKNDMSGTIYGSAGTAVIDANVEYTIEGIDFKIKNVDFVAVSYYETYNGSWVFVYGENDELYLLDMNKAIKTGKFEAVEIKVSTIRVNPRVEDWPIDDKQTWLVIVTDQNDCDYIISRDGTIEKYIRPVYPEEDVQLEIDKNMSYETFEISDGVIKQYEDNTVTVEWNDTIDTYENKLLEVKPNIEYIINGIDGKIKSVHHTIKDRQGKSMSSIKILTENGTMYATFELKTDYKINTGIEYSNIETLLPQQNAEELIAITNNNTAQRIVYSGSYIKGMAPSKLTIYNCILAYCEPSAKLWLNETIDNAFDFITYVEQEDGNYNADVRIKIYDSSINETKTMKAVIVYDAENNNFKVDTFDENPRGGGGY